MSTLRLELPTIADASSDDMSATIDRERRATAIKAVAIAS
jgi:hypothetical protein